LKLLVGFLLGLLMSLSSKFVSSEPPKSSLSDIPVAVKFTTVNGKSPINLQNPPGLSDVLDLKLNLKALFPSGRNKRMSEET